MKQFKSLTFITGGLFLILVVLFSAFSMWQDKQPDFNTLHRSEKYPAIYPDYTEVTIPINMAPLNFRIDEPAERYYLKIEGGKAGEYVQSGSTLVQFNGGRWKELLQQNAGDSLRFNLYTCSGGQWTAWQSFAMHIKPDSIDSHLAYRLIEPGYEKWHIVGIYQRNLENFDERPIIRNDMTGYNCINCHTFNQGNPDQFLLHMRAENGGTYLVQDHVVQKLQTKTDQTMSHLTYPCWHPSGRYVAASVNDTKQFFHAVNAHKMEVFDHASDLVIYDVQQKRILSAASLLSPDSYETFPAFSPDGKRLFFCSAPALEMPAGYDQIRYHLCAVDFDAEAGSLSATVDTLVYAVNSSCSFPRISPDGRFLMYTETAYGQFPIWHTDAELRLLDLSANRFVDISSVNSEDTESYHSWSSNSSWFIFSSRRDNGLYTLPYICYLDEAGNPGKPFLLPQKNPEKYDFQLYSYNLPELIRGEVSINPYQIQDVALNKPAETIGFQ